jgi:hypothetical protein
MEQYRSWGVARVDNAGWARFCAAHLHDYNAAASRLWFGLAFVGALTLAVAGARIVHHEPAELWQILGWAGIVAVAASFPIQIPRSKHSIATGDIVVFLLLALYGPAPAVLAASLEGLIGAVRSSPRLSSRVASLSAAAAGMTLSGALFDGT